MKHPYNFLILHLKHYIFSCKCRGSIPTVMDFKYKFKFNLQVEKQCTVIGSKGPLSYTDLFNSFQSCPSLFN